MKTRKSDSRTVPLGAKFSSPEAKKIRHQAQASGMTVSTLLHDLATTGQVNPRPRIDPIAIEQWRTLAPMAANLNQLTRSINQGRIADTADVSDGISQLRAVLVEIRNTLIGVGEEKDAA